MQGVGWFESSVDVFVRTGLSLFVHTRELKMFFWSSGIEGAPAEFGGPASITPALASSTAILFQPSSHGWPRWGRVKSLQAFLCRPSCSSGFYTREI